MSASGEKFRLSLSETTAFDLALDRVVDDELGGYTELARRFEFIGLKHSPQGHFSTQKALATDVLDTAIRAPELQAIGSRLGLDTEVVQLLLLAYIPRRLNRGE